MPELLPYGFPLGTEHGNVGCPGKLEDVDHEPRPFYMPQEGQPEPQVPVRSLYESRDIGNDDSLVFHRKDSKVWRQRRKGVIGYLGLGLGKGGQQARFPCVRQSHESHVGDQLEFETQGSFFSRQAVLGEPRGTSRGSGKNGVSPASFSTPCRHETIAGLHKVGHRFCSARVKNDRSTGDRDKEILPHSAVSPGPLSRAAVFRDETSFELEIRKGLQGHRGFEVDAPATAAVAAIRSPFGNVFLSSETHASIPAVSRPDGDVCDVKEFHFSHLTWVSSHHEKERGL